MKEQNLLNHKLLESTKNNNSKVNSAPINTQTFWNIFSSLKMWILSLTIITVLSKLFKNYKTIRAFLKVLNYIILTIFGISILDAFWLGFLAKLLGELKFLISKLKSIHFNYFLNYSLKLPLIHLYSNHRGR